MNGVLYMKSWRVAVCYIARVALKRPRITYNRVTLAPSRVIGRIWLLEHPREPCYGLFLFSFVPVIRMGMLLYLNPIQRSLSLDSEMLLNQVWASMLNAHAMNAHAHVYPLYVHAYVHAHMHARACSCACPYARTCMLMCMHAHMHACACSCALGKPYKATYNSAHACLSILTSTNRLCRQWVRDMAFLYSLWLSIFG